MKENKKAILEILKKKSKKDGKFENLVLNLALQKIDSDNFEFDGEAVYTADKKRLVYYMNHDASFTIPEGVEIIGEMAFRGKKQLSHVIIPSTVKEIEHDAFYDCDELDNIYVPASVKAIRAYAFAECDKLKKITFAGTPEKLSRHTFDDCDLLHDIIVPAGSSKFFRKSFTLSTEILISSFWKYQAKTLKNLLRTRRTRKFLKRKLTQRRKKRLLKRKLT